MNEYQDYLNSLQSKYSTPEKVVKEVVSEILGAKVLDLRKITAGEVNEVYDIGLSTNENVILRISQHEDSEFNKEAWAIEKVKLLGVPVPEMLAVTDINLEGLKLHLCIQRKIDGEPLERGNLDRWSLDKDDLRRIINESGAILSKIHSIKVDGFEYLDQNGQGKMGSFKEVMLMHISDEDEYLKLADEMGLNRDVFKRVYEVMREKIKNCPDVSPVLNHNDYGPKHFMVKNNQIVGIIDWGTICGHSPLNDLAKWKFWYEDLPFEWLTEGYTNQDVFKGDWEDILHWIMLNNGLSVMWWYYGNDYKAGVKDVQRRIAKTLEYFK